MLSFAPTLAQRLSLPEKSVAAVLALLAEGATIPFIARYRKDSTGALDEVQIQLIGDEAKALKEFTERKAFIEKTITDAGKMTDSLQAALDKASTLTQLEDIYLHTSQSGKRKHRQHAKPALNRWHYPYWISCGRGIICSGSLPQRHYQNTRRSLAGRARHYSRTGQ